MFLKNGRLASGCPLKKKVQSRTPSLPASSVKPTLEMTQKRRNRGRSKHGRGHVKRVNCDGCKCLPAKDKCIKRFQVRSMVDTTALRDLEENSALGGKHTLSTFSFCFLLISTLLIFLFTLFRCRIRSSKDLCQNSLLCQLCYSQKNSSCKIRY